MHMYARIVCAISAIALLFCLIVGPSVHLLMCFFLLLSLTVCCISLCTLTNNAFVTYLCIGIFSLTLPLTILEGYFYVALSDRVKAVRITDSLEPLPHNVTSVLDPAGEYKRLQATSFFEKSGKEIYDVIYTLDSAGRRITPSAPTAKTAVVLLGCSFTFSEGLNDEEAFAFQLGKALGAEYQVFNFAKSGYGPHRILADLEASIPELKAYERVLFYYVAIDDHLRRISGLAPWDNDGPLYDIKDGKAVRVGTFTDILPFYRSPSVYTWLERSSLYKKVSRVLDPIWAFSIPRTQLKEQLELQGAIMVSMADVIRKKYSKSTFTVMLWPPKTDELFSPLLLDIAHVNMQAWFPSYHEDSAPYFILYPHEFHPSAHANTIVAQKMAQIIRQDAI